MSRQVDKQPESKTCFVIMPITDGDDYEPGHFRMVYDYIIKPACTAAGFTPVRADDVQATNFIVIDILRRIISADMAVCDLSGRNPNVLYELGLRHAFNLPITLIKDSRTQRVFDIQGLRDIEYDVNLRIDTVESARKLLEDTLRNTERLKQKDINSIVQLLGIPAASLPTVNLSPDTSLLLEAIQTISERLSRLEDFRLRAEYPLEYQVRRPQQFVYTDKNGTVINRGSKVIHGRFGKCEVVEIDLNKIWIGNSERGIYLIDPGEAMKDLECIIDNAASD